METPTISKTAYVSNTVSADSFFGSTVGSSQAQQLGALMARADAGGMRRVQGPVFHASIKPQSPSNILVTTRTINAMRIVKVFIADSNENIPLLSRVLYTGEEKLTDLDDNELFFEIPIKALLDAHNEKRVTVIDKKKSTAVNQVLLEPARIRDLKMVVVDVAVFE